MRRTFLAILTTSLTMLLFAVLLTGCGGGQRSDDDDDDFDPAAAKKGGKKKAVAAVSTLKPVKATEYGVIKGKVVFDQSNKGLLDAENDSLKKQMANNTDGAYCASGKGCEVEQQSYRVGANGGLGNVFVWIEPEPGHYFEIPKDQLDAAPKEVLLSQPHCAFLPHCLVLFPSHRVEGKQTPTGQKLVVENDARVGHNAKLVGPDNPEKGELIPARSGDSVKRLDFVLKPSRGEVTITCNIHGWMKAFARVYDHPYATLTSVGADLKAKKYEDLANPAVGTFEIKGVPVGAKVRLKAWHEKFNFLGDPKGMPLELKKDNDIPPITAK